MLVIFTGNGKGKTTAALGQAVRAVGRGKKVLMIQFIKGPWQSGEDFVHIKKKDNGGKFELKKMGLGFVGIMGDTLPREEHEKAARAALDFCRGELAKDWEVIILDEINVAVSLGLLREDEVLASVRGLPAEKLVIFTGRGAPFSFTQAADLVTEMKEIKHPFNKGKLGKMVIEF